MDIKIHQFWEKGYLYHVISILLFSIYALSGKIGIYSDWLKELAYFQYIKASLTDFHSLPWFWWSELGNIAGKPAIAQTRCFISNPETMLFSPFTPLLYLMNGLNYAKFLALIHCLIGIVGLIALRRRLRWDFHQFRTYSILFLLSPIVIQHLSIAYTPWLNLFFFPWLIYFISDEKPSSSIIGSSIILGLILLQGGTHVFIWLTMLISLYSILRTYLERNWSFLFRLLGIYCLTSLLSFARIYATVHAYADFRQSFYNGYNPINFSFWALIPPILVPPYDRLFVKKAWMGVQSWDGGIFWGLAIIMVLVLTKNLWQYKKDVRGAHPGHQNFTLMYVSLFIASYILLILSFFSVFESLVNTVNAVFRLPFVEGIEKYPFRLAIPAYLGFSIVIAAFSKEIMQTLDEFRVKLFKSLIISKLSIVFYFLTTAFFIGICIVFAINIAFSNIIQTIITDTISAAYYGTGHHWLSQMMEAKNILPIENYYAKAQANYQRLESLLPIGIAISAPLILILKANIKKAQYATELALAIPLVFASFMWLSLSISFPYNKFYDEDIPLPKLIAQPGDIDLKIAASPRGITILSQEGSSGTEYVFLEISSRDSKYLTVVSDNALLSDSGGKLSISQQEAGPIVIEFNSSNYEKSIALSMISWLGVMGFVTVRISLALRKRHNASR